MNSLKLPKNRPNGMFIYCQKCKCYFANDSSTKFKKHSCNSSAKLKYVAKIHIPGTINKIRFKTLTSVDLNDAVIEFYEYKNSLNSNGYDKPIGGMNTPTLLGDIMAEYLSFLDNEGVPIHKIKVRSDGHKSEVKRYFKYFLECLRLNDFKAENFKFNAINDDVVGKLHTYLIEVKKFQPKTYNKYMGCMKQLAKFANKKYKINVTEAFEVKQLANPEKIIHSVRPKDFVELLKIISHERGICTYSNGVKKNLYRPWLKEGFLLVALTGRRREEIVELKNGDIIFTNDDSSEGVILSSNLKVNRINHSEVNVINAKIPVTNEIKQLLIILKHDPSKPNEYLFARDETRSRKNIMDDLSKAFSHYYKQLNTGKNLQLKNLRKTFTTIASIQLKGDAKELTSHADDQVLNSHYVDLEIYRDKMKFELFGEETYNEILKTL